MLRVQCVVLVSPEKGDVLMAWQTSSLSPFFLTRKEMALEAWRWLEEEAVAVGTGVWALLVVSRKLHTQCQLINVAL